MSTVAVGARDRGSQGSFGPSALATPANALTLARFLATPVFIALVALRGASWAAVAVGLPLVATDVLDGWIARRMGTTRSGAFLDPLADKILVIGTLVVLVDKHVMWWLPVALVTVRELAISVMRSHLGRRGISVPASGLAKLKTLAQDCAVGFAVLPLLSPRHLVVARGFLWVAVVLSLWTGLQYLAAYRGAGGGARYLKVEVVAVGTELLLGQIVDSNSSWMGQRLAEAGIDSHYQTKVGDNLDRIVSVLGLALGRSDAVLVCGGLGPTQDDITREAIAQVMGVQLVRDAAIADRIRSIFTQRNRPMAENNLRQADVPVGAIIIPQTRGTAPGLICPVGDKVVYAMPGVPYEMQDMMERAVVPDLKLRSGEVAVIRSRTLRTWGLAESSLAELVAPRLEHLDRASEGPRPTIAFLASGIEGIRVRITVKAPSSEQADAAIAVEEAELRQLLGDLVFGVDDETMEHAVGKALSTRGWNLAVAESFTGGLVASRLVNVPGSSAWFKGGVVAYDPEIKFGLLGVARGPLVTAVCARQMAEGVRRLTDSDVGLSTTGEAGPEPQEDVPVGTVFLGLALPDRPSEAIEVHLPGDRERIRQFGAISLLDGLRRRLGE